MATAPTIIDQDTEHAPDVEAIERVIADVERGFNTNDPELSVEHFAANATTVTALGVEVDGRDALLEANRAGLAGPLRDEHARYRVVDVVFVRPDVALARKHAKAIDESGAPTDAGHAMSALYVLVKDAGRWWIMARQNTLVRRPG